MLWLILGLAGVEDGLWGETLSTHVSLAGVDYQAIGPTGLDPYLAQLAGADLSSASKAEKMAFWINAYNALTVDLISENQEISSIRDLDRGKVWDARKFTVAGQQLSLNDIEHGTLRPMGDARVHAALNCASKGCPPLPLKPHPHSNTSHCTSPSRQDRGVVELFWSWFPHGYRTSRHTE